MGEERKKDNMASQHSSDKKPITVWIKSALVKRLDEMAREYGLSRAALLTLWILSEKKPH